MGGYSSDKNSLFTWPVYFHVLPSSPLQYTWLIIHDVVLINPLVGKAESGLAIERVLLRSSKTELSGEVKEPLHSGKS